MAKGIKDKRKLNSMIRLAEHHNQSKSPMEVGDLTEILPATRNVAPTGKQSIVIGRRTMVASRMLRGWSQDKIANDLGHTPEVVKRDMDSIWDMWREHNLEDIERVALRDLARLDAAIDVIWPSVELGDLFAIAALSKLIDQRGIILGYRHGVKVDFEAYIRQVAESQGYDPDKAVQIAIRVTASLS